MENLSALKDLPGLGLLHAKIRGIIYKFVKMVPGLMMLIFVKILQIFVILIRHVIMVHGLMAELVPVIFFYQIMDLV